MCPFLFPNYFAFIKIAGLCLHQYGEFIGFIFQ